MNWFKKAQNYIKAEEEYAIKIGIDPESLWYLGKGDNGEAFITGKGTVIKITSSQSEANMAEKIKNMSNLNFAQIYDVSEIRDGVFGIHQEKIEEDSHIEDIFYQYMNILDEQGLSIPDSYYFDEDNASEEAKEFIEANQQFITQLEDIIRSYRRLGIEAMDISPNNLGRNQNGELKAFDIDEIRR